YPQFPTLWLPDATLDHNRHPATDGHRGVEPDPLCNGAAAIVAALARPVTAVVFASAVAAQPLQEAGLGAFGPALPVALAHALLDVLGHLLILVARLHDHTIFPSPCLAGDLARFDRVDGDALHDGAGPLALLAHVLAPERV